MEPSDRPLRAVLMESVVVNGTWHHKGEVYDIAAIENNGWGPVVGLKLETGLLVVPPSKILVLAPDNKNETRTKRHKDKKQYNPKSKKRNGNKR